MTRTTEPQGRRATVAVFGATGHTGRFVVAELLRRGIRPLAIGRDPGKLAAAGFTGRGVPIAGAAIDDPASLDRAFSAAQAVINCAGPFLDTAPAIAAAAIRLGIHYLDVTAEQPSVQETYAAFDGAAREAGVVVLPAMAFYGGLTDLMATVAVGDRGSVDDIAVGIFLDSWRPTLGTRITGQRNTAQRLTIRDGALAPLPPGTAETSWAFCGPLGRQGVTELPFSETILIARHLRTSRLRTYINHAPLRDLRDATTPAPTPADATGRSAQTFQLEVAARRGNETRRVIARGRDIYAVTAPLVCEAVQRLLAGQAGHAGTGGPRRGSGARRAVRRHLRPARAGAGASDARTRRRIATGRAISPAGAARPAPHPPARAVRPR